VVDDLLVCDHGCGYEGCELEIAGTIPSDGCGDLGAELTVELLGWAETRVMV
jgi:hypothetical protein